MFLMLQCNFMPRRGFRRGGYTCNCTAGFFIPQSSSQSLTRHQSDESSARRRYFSGVDVEQLYADSTAARDDDISGAMQCSRCAVGCVACDSEESCNMGEPTAMSLAKVVPLCVQSFSMLATVVIAIIIGRLRHTKVGKASAY